MTKHITETAGTLTTTTFRTPNAEETRAALSTSLVRG
jgi:hypothetical protein